MSSFFRSSPRWHTLHGWRLPPDPPRRPWDRGPDRLSLCRSSAEQAVDGQAGGPGGSLHPEPEGEISRASTWGSVEALAKQYYPDLAVLRDASPLLDYPFLKGVCPGELTPEDRGWQ